MTEMKLCVVQLIDALAGTGRLELDDIIKNVPFVQKYFWSEGGHLRFKSDDGREVIVAGL